MIRAEQIELQSETLDPPIHTLRDQNQLKKKKVGNVLDSGNLKTDRIIFDRENSKTQCTPKSQPIIQTNQTGEFYPFLIIVKERDGEELNEPFWFAGCDRVGYGGRIGSLKNLIKLRYKEFGSGEEEGGIKRRRRVGGAEEKNLRATEKCNVWEIF